MRPKVRLFAVSYVRNVRGRAMLPDSTVNKYFNRGDIEEIAHEGPFVSSFQN